jgi:glycosyltransferase involved in cell wall biosynthesis
MPLLKTLFRTYSYVQDVKLPGSTTSTPKITVLMPVYNGDRYLTEAIESILKQTFSNFEFLIINDGSKDRSIEIIRSFTDPRIRLIENEKNIGLIKTLNKGIDLSRGEYIVRMDQDDVSLPNRLTKQVFFMDTHQRVGVCGTWYKTIGGGKSIVARYATDQDVIYCALLFNSTLAHPTVIMRRKYFQDNNLYYDPSYIHAEDYELWTKASKYFEISCISEVLLLYRVHPGQTTMRLNEEQIQTSGMTRLKQIKKLEINPTEDEFNIHQSISLCNSLNASNHFFNQVDSWLSKLKAANDAKRVFPDPAFTKVLIYYYIALFNKSPLSAWQWVPKLFRSKLLNMTGMQKKYVIAYIVQLVRNKLFFLSPI